jgi:lon-related putative ATP-dependent protease
MAEAIRELKPEELRWTCDPDHFKFENTSQLTPMTGLIEQERATRAIRFGLGITGMGYNIYVAGLTGTGKMTAIKSFLQETVRQGPPPQDWCYVYNFNDPYAPMALALPAGLGRKLQQGLEDLIDHLKVELPKAFESKEFEQTLTKIGEQSQENESRMLEELQRLAAERGFLINLSKAGISLIPLERGQPMEKEHFDSLPEEDKKLINQKRQEFQPKIKWFLRRIREHARNSKERLEQATHRVGLFVVGTSIDELQEKFREHAAVVSYLDEVQADILGGIPEFLTATGNEPPSTVTKPAKTRNQNSKHKSDLDLFSRYRVNVIVDNTGVASPPVILETNPSLMNLMGRIERRALNGTLVTDFTLLKAGSLVQANGGFLVLNAIDLFSHMGVWESLKRVIKNQEISIEDVPEQYGAVPIMGLKPQPIPYSGKIILVGNLSIYHYLYQIDEDFRKIFKVKADFDAQMTLDQNHMNAYANFVATRCHEEGLRHFDRSGVAAVVEHGARLVDDQHRLTARFSDVADLLREASYWAGLDGSHYVCAAHVEKAAAEKDYRSNLIEDRLRDLIREETLLVQVTGSAVGQVNGLGVVDMGDYRFGKPSRITVKTFMGRSGIIDIEREAKMSGRIYNKGVMIMSGYLGWKYAQKAPLTLAASICFEQSYEGVDGDSASSTELYALLSSLSDVPIRQGLAVTGSVNQSGEIQPIGGVNEKVEGFFEVCRMLGYTGDQGVLIPYQNVKHLMLKKSVIDAVRDGQFHIYPVRTINEGIEILTGVPAGELKEDSNYPEGTVHYGVSRKLAEFLTQYEALEGGAHSHDEEEECCMGDDDDDDDDDDDE